jgi:hypothetical protein
VIKSGGDLEAISYWIFQPNVSLLLTGYTNTTFVERDKSMEGCSHPSVLEPAKRNTFVIYRGDVGAVTIQFGKNDL